MIEADASAWLDVWERAAPGPRRRRRRELLAGSGLPGGFAAAQLEIGRANARLLRLHRAMFGRQLSCSTECPRCKAVLELDVDVDDLLAREPREPATLMRVQVADWEVSFRLPTEGDVDAALLDRDLPAAATALMRRCVEACRQGAEEAHVSMAPPELAAWMTERIEESDPLACLDLELGCAECGHVWSSTLEVDVLLWARLNAWALRLARDVSALARAYSWSERAIMEMSPSRRQLYLDLVDG